MALKYEYTCHAREDLLAEFRLKPLLVGCTLPGLWAKSPREFLWITI